MKPKPKRHLSLLPSPGVERCPCCGHVHGEILPAFRMAMQQSGINTVAEWAKAAGLTVAQALPVLTGAEEVVEEIRFMQFIADEVGITLSEVGEHWPAICDHLRSLPDKLG